MVRWLEHEAWRLALDGETICWARDMRTHLDRCRETGEDPFPDAITVEELQARCRALIDGDDHSSRYARPGGTHDRAQ